MRTKKDFPTGKLRLKYPVSSFDANKKYTLYYEYSFDGAIIRKDTGYRVRVKDWNKDGNEKKGALRSSYGADYIHDNSKLITALFKYDSEIMAFVLKYLGEINRDLLDQYIEYRKLVKGNSNARPFRAGYSVPEGCFGFPPIFYWSRLLLLR